MGSFSEFYISRPPALRPVVTCDCPSLTAQPNDPAFWPWAVRNVDELRNYIADLGTEVSEKLIAFYVDQHLNLLAIDVFSDDQPEQVSVPVGRILCRGRQLNCQGLILVHNHPSGDNRPSRADIALTKRVAAAAEAMDITLLEHVICAGVEMRKMNYI